MLSYAIICYHMRSYVIICITYHHVSSYIIVRFPQNHTHTHTHIYIQTMWLLQPRFPQSSGTGGCRVGWRSLGEQRHRSLGMDIESCFVMFFCFFVFFCVYSCLILKLHVSSAFSAWCWWFRWKEFDESSGHGHSAIHVIHAATPRTRRLRGEIWFSKTFVRCDAGNWAFKASFSSQRGVV